MEERKLTGNEVGETARGCISWTFVFPKYFGFYSKYRGKPLEDFEGWSDTIRFGFEGLLWPLGGAWRCPGRDEEGLDSLIKVKMMRNDLFRISF